MLASSLKIDSIFNENYQIKSGILSKSGPIQRYKILNINLDRAEVIAIDFEGSQKLKYEFDILSKFQNYSGFPKAYESNFLKFPRFYTGESYFSDISSLVKEYKQFDLVTAVSVFLQALEALEIMHNAGFVHRNINPKALVISENREQLIIYYSSESSLIGSAQIIEKNKLSCNFSSIAAHKGIWNCKDDLESLGYLLIYMLTGKLPWKGALPKGTFSKWQKVFIMKASQSVKDICANCPNFIENYLSYVKSLKDLEKPDYVRIKSLFLDNISVNSLNHFLWSIKKRKKTTKKKTVKKEIVARMKTQGLQKPENIRLKKLRSKSNIFRVLPEESSPESNIYVNTEENDSFLPVFHNRENVMRTRDDFYANIKSEARSISKPPSNCEIL